MEDLKREYLKTQADKQSYLDGLLAGTLTDSPAVKYVITRLEENLDIIKSVIEKYSREASMTPDQASTTLDKFDALFDRHKTDRRHRLKAQYCYDVRESETFKATFKAEVAMKEILT